MPHVFQARSRTGELYPRWRFQFTDSTGKRRTAVGMTSKRETEKMAIRIQIEHDEIRKGLIPTSKANWKAARNRRFEEVLQEYMDWGNSQGGRGGRPWSKCHFRKKNERLNWWKRTLNLELMLNMENVLPRVEEQLRILQKQGKSGKTLSMYSGDLFSFCNWCTERGYLPNNPLRKICKFSKEPTFRRRAMTRDELKKLLNAAPEHRRLLYEVACLTGLRAGELRALSVDDLDTDNNGLRLSANWTKNRKSGFQPLPRDLADRLRKHADTNVVLDTYRAHYSENYLWPSDLPEKPLLYVPSHTGRDLELDLRIAGIAKNIKDEGKLDFHALRVAYITFVIESGANIKEAQTLARHSTPEMTLNVYARVRPDRLNAIVESMKVCS